MHRRNGRGDPMAKLDYLSSCRFVLLDQSHQTTSQRLALFHRSQGFHSTPADQMNQFAGGLSA